MKYPEFIIEARELLEEGRTLLVNEKMGGNPALRKWRTRLRLVVREIERQGYEPHIITRSLNYSARPDEDVELQLATFKQYHDNLQDTLNELETVVRNYERYGEPKLGVAAVDSSSIGSNGLELRAQMDSEHFRSLLWINGGSAVALFSFLPFVIDDAKYTPLVQSSIIGLLGFFIGLFAAIVHNAQRRTCSLRYDEVRAASPSHPDPCTILGLDLGEPCVCIRSKVSRWFSLLIWAAGGATVIWGAFQVFGNPLN